MATMNPWENNALQYRYTQNGQGQVRWQAPSSDPIIYPGLYAPSGFDIMSILINVSNRPNAKYELGPIDCSCAIVLCDLLDKNTPIVYASEGFSELTGYSRQEILGQNCRILQYPDGNVKGNGADKESVRKLRKALEKKEEVQMEVVNYKKGGIEFKNFLTIIPLRWDEVDNRYAVGFLCEID